MSCKASSVTHLQNLRRLFRAAEVELRLVTGFFSMLKIKRPPQSAAAFV